MEVKKNIVAELIVNDLELEQLNAFLEDEYQDGDYVYEDISSEFLATFDIQIEFEYDVILIILVD